MHASFRHFARAALVLAAFALSGSAFAQATRTWISGVGDDVNPCSRTAPCKTFAGAISKTATGGEISVLDPGGFGAVTITKSITLDGNGIVASILTSGTNGININAPGARVTIRNLSINGINGGASAGLNGINVINVGSLTVENVTIFGMGQYGINFSPGASAELFLNNVTIQDCILAGFGGVLIAPGAGFSAVAELNNVRLLNNNQGLRVEARGLANLSNSVVAGNTNAGVVAQSNSLLSPDGLAMAVVNATVISGNGANGGVRSSGAGAQVNIANNTISNNTAGLVPTSSGLIVSYGNNNISGNATNGAPTSTIGTL